MPSIADLVALWIEAIEGKIWTYEPDGPQPQINDALIADDDYFRRDLLG